MVNKNSKRETWSFKPLNDYLDLLTDYDANGSFADMAANVHTEWGHGYAWYVRATDLEQNLSMADVRYADEYSYNFLEKTSLFGGELLMAKRGEIGKIYFFQMRSKYATLAPNLYLLKLNDRMDSRFLYYYFLSSEGQKKIKAINASTSLGAIYKDDVKRILVPELDIKEQKQIAETLSGIDSLISKLQELIVKKKNIRQGTMQRVLTGKNRLQGFSSEWKDTTLGNICDIKDGTHQTPHYVESGIPFYSVETVTNDDFTHVKYISLEEHERLTSSYKIENGDVLMTRIGSIGKGKYVDWNPNASFYVSLALLKFRGNKPLANFIALLTGTEEFQKEAELHSLQFAIPMKINLGQISDIRVRIPAEAGKKVVAENPEKIDSKYLEQFPSFVDFASASDPVNGDDSVSTISKPTDLTPDDQLEDAYKQINASLASDLLSEVLKISPYTFEKLVVDLLSKMGYGTVAYGSHATVASGDDGIDGVIMEDKLGFSLIYMQAKEWAPDRVVGQPDIQSFVGAIAGKHGDGLFVTTAKFSQKAKDYANTHHIILIDGERLANLMIEYNFCVSTRKTFEIKAIDTDALAEYQDE